MHLLDLQNRIYPLDILIDFSDNMGYKNKYTVVSFSLVMTLYQTFYNIHNKGQQSKLLY